MVTRTGGAPFTDGPVGFQTPSPGSGCWKIGLIGGGQLAACFVVDLVAPAEVLEEPRARPIAGAVVANPTFGRLFSCGPPFFGAFIV